MGANTLRRSCSISPSVEAPAPNPIRYTINRVFEGRLGVAVDVHYPDCTNYEGRKIIVMLNVTEAEVRAMSELDPHFSEHSAIFARFAPTDIGWNEAENLVE